MTWRATSARLVIRRYLNPRFMSHMACYDVEYSIHIWHAMTWSTRATSGRLCVAGGAADACAGAAERIVVGTGE